MKTEPKIKAVKVGLFCAERLASIDHCGASGARCRLATMRSNHSRRKRMRRMILLIGLLFTAKLSALELTQADVDWQGQSTGDDREYTSSFQ